MPKKNQSTKASSKSLTNMPKDNQTKVNPHSSLFKRVLTWLDDNILLVLIGFLFGFIPLYPKLPLADLIPGYIVRLRLEDLFVGFTIFIYGIQLWRKKVTWQSPFTWIIGAYAAVGLLSTLSAVLITKTVPFGAIHIAKTLLHYFRYLEYFSLFFIAYSAIKTRKHVLILAGILLATVIGISAYGYGQRYYYWPVYSTMNREFSKGIRLYLTEHARVQSTFGGHYDMSAYLVLTLPIVLAIALTVKNKIVKVFSFAALFVGTWLIIMGGSRSSFGAMVVGIGVVIAGVAFTKKSFLKKIWFGVSRGFLIYSILLYMFMSYGDSIYERFLQTLQGYPELHKTYHLANDRRRHFYRDYIAPTLASINIANIRLPEAQKPENSISTDEAIDIIVSSDQQPTPAQNIPSDVYVNVPDIIYVATEEGGVATITAKEVPRTYSDSASQHGLSMGIRLDTLWPRALQGFYTNPLLGSGYATLTKESVYQFTEAESTDNNFLRTLGETGLLGFVTFYGTMALSMWLAVKTYFTSKDTLIRTLAVGLIAATIGLLINAIFIDVFASSKVAFTYWTVTGIAAAVFLKHIQLSHDASE